MNRRGYQQGCAIAGSLDLLGERWTLLIVRDLLIGPRRYTDLLAGLPGIGTNLLARRLQSLADAGIVQRDTLPPPAATRVYRLTPKGLALERPLVELCRWGLLHRISPFGDTFHDARWTVLAMRAAFDTERAIGCQTVCEFRVDDTVFHAAVDDGQLSTALGPANSPDLILTLEDRAFRQLAAGAVDLELLLSENRAKLVGEVERYNRFASVFAV